ncbi:MAG TPA: NAD(P)-dependent oxidoreductase [Ilumatobacteraceae bacterium]|nr:NAD(P)-dependent oxidoreductase [Ilumatobacteraceae bacterium]
MIVLLESVHPDALALLERADHVRVMANPIELDADLPFDEVRAVLTRGRGRITAEMYRRLPNLQVVGRCGAGLDNIDTVAAKASGIAVVHAPGRTTHAVSEHALLLMLALARRVTVLDGAVQRGAWGIREGYEGIELRGKRLGIIGLGAIGRRVAEIGASLGMNVAYWSRTSRDPTLSLLEFDELLSIADVIQICVALTPDTHGLIGSEQFARMKRGVLLINTARAQIVDHSALLAAITVGIIGGYGADVWDPEPPTADDPLLADERVVITPHVAGLTDVTYRAICVEPAAAAVAILNGDRPDPTCIYSNE